MANDEVWKSIPGYKQYEVSNLGNVRSVDRWVRFGKTESLRFTKGQVIRKCINNNGYEQVTLCRETGRHVHHLVLLAFVGPRPNGMEALHGDGNKANNRLDNLRYGTRSENQHDRAKHGTSNNRFRLVICETCGAKKRIELDVKDTKQRP
jgi:hypothetical protein